MALDFQFNKMRELYPDLSEDEFLTKMEGPETLITSASPPQDDSFKQMAVEKVRQKYLGDKYNDVARQKLVDANAKEAGSFDWSAALGGFGAGLQGKSAVDAASSIRNKNLSRGENSLRDFDQGRNALVQDLEMGQKLERFDKDADLLAREEDVNSEESALAQSLAREMVPSQDFSGFSASKINKMLPSMQKIYEGQQRRMERGDSLDLRRSELLEKRAERADIRADKRDALEAKKTEGLTEGEKSVDKDYAKQYNAYTGKGRSNAVNTIDKLDRLAEEVGKDTGIGEAGGGRIGSMLPDSFRSRTAIQRRDDARNFANTTLKELFGGQLSDGEREAAAREYWNDSLDNESNSKRLKQKVKELRDNVAAEDAKVKYYQENRGLKGFEFKPLDKKAKTISQGGHTYTWNESTDEYE